MESRHGQIDFSGGLNVNPRTALHELQEATDISLDDFGVVRPEKSDTQIIEATSVTCVRVIDGQIYHLVGTTLYKNEIELGTIGAGTFYVAKQGEIHFIIASDKVYKVIGTDLSQLGIAAPASAPTLAAVAQSSLQVEAFESAATFAASGCVLSDDAVNNKEGTNAMKIAISAASSLATASKAVVADLTEYADGTVSEDEDLISLWVYVNDASKLDYIMIMFDINTGDFQNDHFRKIIPVMPSSFDSSINEDLPISYLDPIQDTISWDEQYQNWDEQFEAHIRSEFDTDSSSDLISRAKRKVKKQLLDSIQSKINSSAASFTQIKIRKNTFLRFGSTSNKGWDTVAAIRIAAMANEPACEVSVDDLKLIGGGALTGYKYKVSYSYVSKFTLSNGNSYEEESALSDETDIFNLAQQNMSVSAIADSSDSQVTHKRIYIRGNNLTLRHRAGEIAASATAFTIDDKEEELVVLPVEDNRKNGVPPTSPVHGIYLNGRLFLVKSNRVFWSKSYIPGAFESDASIDMAHDVKALAEKGSNLLITMKDFEAIYLNPGFGSLEGGYLHYVKNPQGCVSTSSMARGYYASFEGICNLLGPEPRIISGRIRSELLSFDLSDSVGAYLRGSYFLYVPAASAMYEFDSINNRFLKHGGVTFVSAGDNGLLYVVKSDGIYTHGTNESSRKAFSVKFSELVIDKDQQFRHVVLDTHLGTAGATVEYYLNGKSKTSTNKTSNERKLIHLPVTQEAGSRVNIKVSSASAITDTDFGIYGVFLK